MKVIMQHRLYFWQGLDKVHADYCFSFSLWCLCNIIKTTR